MKHSIKYARLLFRLLYEYTFAVMLVISLKLIFKSGTPKIWECMCILLAFILSYAIREWVGVTALIPVIHILMGAVFFALPMTKGMTLLSIAIMIYLTLESVSYAIRGGILKPISDVPWPTFMAGFIIYLYGLALDNDIILYTAYIAPAILLVLHYVMTYLEGLREYVTRTRDVSGLPISKMIQLNTVIVMFILLLLVLSLCMVRIFDTDAAWSKLYAIFTMIVVVVSQVIKIVAALISGLISGDYESDDETIAAAQQEMTNAAVYATDAMEFILKLFVVAVVVYVAYKIVGYVIKKLSAKRYYADDLVEEAESIRHEITEDNKRKKRFAIRSLSDRARWYYRVRILDFKREIQLDEYKTSHDIEEQIDERGLADVTELTEAYNELRYGDKETDKETVRRMKILSKKITKM